MYKRLISAALVFGAAALAPPASAQMVFPCFVRSELAQTLTDTFREMAHGAGLQGATRLVELWISPETGTFTVLLSHPNGISCVLASGIGWETFLPAPSGTAG
jgi:hypothetical protein